MKFHIDASSRTEVVGQNATFKCPKFDCKTFYFVTNTDESPMRTPRCAVCETPFLARDNAGFLQYRPTCEVIDLTS